jgi:hypothetical protein
MRQRLPDLLDRQGTLEVPKPTLFFGRVAGSRRVGHHLPASAPRTLDLVDDPIMECLGHQSLSAHWLPVSESLEMK